MSGIPAWARRMVSRTARAWTKGMLTSARRLAARKPIPKYMIGSIMDFLRPVALVCGKSRSVGCNQAPAGRDHPTAAPAHNRVDPSRSGHRVSNRYPPDTVGSLQHGRATEYIPNRPALNCVRPGVWRRCGSGLLLSRERDRCRFHGAVRNVVGISAARSPAT